MSKVGAHVVSGSRNGYGPFCTAKPALILAHGEGGALVEARTNSDGYTLTIFRHTFYKDAPEGIDRMTPAQARALAETHYPTFKAKWAQNPADYYTVLNEPAGNDLGVLPTYLAYELRFMELAEVDRIKLCVLNLAGGTPGNLDNWKTYYVPHITRAFVGGHIYGRHAYGGAKLSVPDGNTNRPMIEAEHLRSVGLGYGGLAITEAGQNGGYGFIGTDAWMADITAYNTQLLAHSNIIGAAFWTLGNAVGFNANWQDALPRATTWVAANPTPKWVPGTPPPPTPTKPKVVILKKPQKADMTEAENVAANGYAWSDYGRTTTHSTGDMITMLKAGNTQSYAILAYPDRASQDEAMDALLANGFTWVNWPTLPGFRLSSPVAGIPLQITSGGMFNAPRDYPDPRYKHHEGLDLRAVNANGQPVKVVASVFGVIDGIRRIDPGTGYGLYVRVKSLYDGVNYTVWYGHLSAIPASLAVGQVVVAGQEIGTAGNTGNSSGIHLHLTVQKVPGGLPNYIVDSVIDPAPLLGLPATTLPGPGTPPTTTVIDLLPYIKGDGRLYEVRHVSGNQERFQTQSSGSTFWQTKNSQYEELAYDATYIWRGLDTSPGPAPAYAERPGVPRYYTAKEQGQSRARWCKRYMTIGETFIGPGHHVQFYYKDNCQMSGANSGNATNRTAFVAKHASKTWGTITVQDVVELTNGTERWFFARGFGLVAWSSAWGSSAISEIHNPGTRPDNIKETGCFSGA